MQKRYGRRFAWVAIVAAFLWACTPEPTEYPDGSETPTPNLADAPARDVGNDLFVDRAATSGLVFRRFNGMSGRKFLAEITCGGGALFDADGDGDLDVYLLQGRLLGSELEPPVTADEATLPLPHDGDLVDRLYLNRLGDEPPAGGTSGDGAWFTDATSAMGVRADGYGCAVTTGDFDGDGRVDVYVLNLGANQLLRNAGPADDGPGVRFEDVTAASGTAAPGPGTAAVAFDLEGDGDLDLFVANYSDFDPVHESGCFSLMGAPDYCGPGAYPSRPDRLLRNRGDGTFDDVSESAGLRAVEPRPALGAVAADFDDDGHLDLYVANDGEANHLWMSNGDGTFREEALLAGAALNRYGAAEASMGVDAGDVDDDGDWDLVIAHLAKETHTLYLNDGHGVFTDATAQLGLGPPTVPLTGFGIAWLDADLDGLLDLAVADGAVTVVQEQLVAGDVLPLAQRQQLLRLERGAGGSLGYVDADDLAGADLVRPGVGRGLAVGDVDDDGDADLLLVEVAGPPRLLINRTQDESPRQWIGARVVTASGRDDRYRDALGAVVELVRGAGSVRRQRVATDGSFASARDPRVVFALAEGDRSVTLRVRWVDGTVEEFSGLAPNRYHLLQREKILP